jgi:hypothetical protein
MRSFEENERTRRLAARPGTGWDGPFAQRNLVVDWRIEWS